MALFTQGVLTRKGQALVAKCETTGNGIKITKVCTGSGEYSSQSPEILEQMTALKNKIQEFGISDLATVSGNDGVAVITVVINNRGLTELYYLNELGVYAEDPDEGEILYCLLVSDNNTVYIPPDNESGGISTVTERIYLEVTNADKTTIETGGAVVSASDFLALRQIVDAVTLNLKGGENGQMLTKDDATDYGYSWKDINTVTRPYAKFPEEGRADAVYVDSESSEIYIWKANSSGVYEYFKLPLGAEASETLQKQITTNANNIAKLLQSVATLEGHFDELIVKVPVSGWEESTSDGVSVYTNDITIKGMTADFDGTVFPYVLSTGASAVVKEMEAIGVYFSKGITESQDGKLHLTCYKKCPKADFGIQLQGIKETT